MGAKTNQFIKDIEGLALGCGPLGLQLAQIYGQIQKLTKEGQDLYGMHAKRLAVLEKQLGVRPGADDTRLEKLLETDPVIGKIDKRSDAIGQETNKLRLEKTKIVAELKKVFTPFKNKLAEFEAFISKKEKSKNPFKSKASVPGAKKFIARMKKLQNDMITMAS